MSNVLLIALRTAPHRGRRVLQGERFSASRAEARALVARRLAIRAPVNSAADVAIVTPGAETVGDRVSAEVSSIAPHCTDAQHVWPGDAVVGSKCLCRAQRLSGPDDAPATAAAVPAPAVEPTMRDASPISSSDAQRDMVDTCESAAENL